MQSAPIRLRRLTCAQFSAVPDDFRLHAARGRLLRELLHFKSAAIRERPHGIHLRADRVAVVNEIQHGCQSSSWNGTISASVGCRFFEPADLHALESGVEPLDVAQRPLELILRVVEMFSDHVEMILELVEPRVELREDLLHALGLLLNLHAAETDRQRLDVGIHRVG